MIEWIDANPQRIVVFRATRLGELLCAVPALRALRAAFPAAEITLVGLPCARALAQRLPQVDHFIDFPGYPGLPEQPCNVRALPDFLAQVQARRFDLALQMHDGSSTVNALVATFGAGQCAGFAAPGSWVPPDDAPLYCRWPERGHAVERALALPDHLRLPRRGTQLEFPLTDDDRDELREALRRHGSGLGAQTRYVCVHAGAQRRGQRSRDPRRMAEAADALVQRGRTVVLTGSASEQGLVADLAACMRHEAVDLCGHTTLWTLGALIERAESVVCHDVGTGISHLAAALRCPCLAIGGSAEAGARGAGPAHRLI